MEVIKKWDNYTLIVYLLLAILIALLFKLSIIFKKDSAKIKLIGQQIEAKYICYIIIYLIFIFFSCFRYIAPGVGGADTLVYINYFENLGYVHFSIKETLLFSGYEYLFFNFMFLIRILGGNYYVFQFFIYSIIILCYIYIIDKNVKDDKNWFWMILLFLPLLKSINIIRNSFAAALGFIAIDQLNEKKYKNFIIFSLLAFFNHYISIILLPLGLFCYYIPDKYFEDTKKIMYSITISLIGSMIILPIAKIFLKISGFVGYLDKIEISLMGYIPIIISIVLILIYSKSFVKYLKKINHFIYFKMMIYISLILPIFILLNGASRILLFFEIPRYILYCDLYAFMKEKIDKKYHLVCDITCTILIIMWVIFRIYRMWDGYSIMPYYNILFL